MASAVWIHYTDVLRTVSHTGTSIGVLRHSIKFLSIVTIMHATFEITC